MIVVPKYCAIRALNKGKLNLLYGMWVILNKTGFMSVD